MAYKIKNGFVWVQYKGAWWLDTVLFTIYPELKKNKLYLVK